MNLKPVFKVTLFFDAKYLNTILKHDPTSHLATARASDSVIYSDIARIQSTYYYYYLYYYYLTNGYRYGHSYYRRRIGNYTQAFE